MTNPEIRGDRFVESEPDLFVKVVPKSDADTNVSDRPTDDTDEEEDD